MDMRGVGGCCECPCPPHHHTTTTSPSKVVLPPSFSQPFYQTLLIRRLDSGFAKTSSAFFGGRRAAALQLLQLQDDDVASCFFFFLLALHSLSHSIPTHDNKQAQLLSTLTDACTDAHIQRGKPRVRSAVFLHRCCFLCLAATDGHRNVPTLLTPSSFPHAHHFSTPLTHSHPTTITAMNITTTEQGYESDSKNWASSSDEDDDMDEEEEEDERQQAAVAPLPPPPPPPPAPEVPSPRARMLYQLQ